jgi:crotonobetainyl-CoA:carnitine CoA-transferase CaiB-like acyl-CoA transferase
VENFTYRVMDDLGIGYDELKKHNPKIILVGMPPMGKTGPYAPWTTYGQQLFSFSGMCYLWAHPESPMESRSKIAYADDTSAPQMVFAMLAALEYRDRTGKGQFVEIAQCEGLAYMMNPIYMDYFINSRVWEPRGTGTPSPLRTARISASATRPGSPSPVRRTSTGRRSRSTWTTRTC